MDIREHIIHDLMGKTVHVIIDRPIGYEHHGIVYPVNYGYIPCIITGDGEPQDAYILGVTEPIAEFDGCVVGAIRRKNDVEDKLVVAPAGVVFHQGQIAEAVHFQEQFFETTVDSLFRKSCGVLPYRVNNAEKEFLLVYEHFSQCWSLPKGHMEAGETEEQTALREIKEETGLSVTLLSGFRTEDSHALVREGRPDVTKHIVYFLAEYDGQALHAQAGEVSAIALMTFDEAMAAFQFESSRRILREAAAYIKAARS